MKKHPVVEIFGPTLQGEGEMAGRRTHFIRFGGCPYRCSWCDTMYAVEPEEVKKNATYMDAVEIKKATMALGWVTRWVTLTGGDPVMHKLNQTINELNDHFYIAVETQGSLWQDWLTDCEMVTISPKPPSSGMYDKMDWKMLEQYVRQLGRRLNIKVVCFSEDDIDWAVGVHQQHNNIPFTFSVGTPLYETPQYALDQGIETLTADVTSDILHRYRILADAILMRNDLGDVRVLPQLHTLLWGQKRGV